MTDNVRDILPVPRGYRILVEIPKVEETYGASGIIKTSKSKDHDHVLSFCGLVLAMGDEAYTDTGRFPSGPWCEVGDYVMFRMNSGTRFKVGDTEYRILNDDTVEAVVGDPRNLTRAS